VESWPSELDSCCKSNQQSTIVDIHLGGDIIFLLHHQWLVNRCQFTLSLEGTVTDSTVGGGVMNIRVRYLLPIKSTSQYCRDSSWREYHLYVTPARYIQQMIVFFEFGRKCSWQSCWRWIHGHQIYIPVSSQTNSIVEIHRGGDTIFLLHQQGLFNR
jgi:hypothetical protein